MWNTIGIFMNPTKRESEKVAQHLEKLFSECGCKCIRALPEDGEKLIGCEVLCVLGGDGTILAALDIALKGNMPILGINLGHMGFLSEIEPTNLDECIPMLLRGKFVEDERMLIEGCVDGKKIVALNEISIVRTAFSGRVLTIEAEVNGCMVSRISGDGIIASTVTGSTAYSLSAGGPIIAPSVNAFVLTPICPHTMASRPVVVSAEDTIRLRVIGDTDSAQVLCDGKVAQTPVSEIVMRKSEKTVKFLRLGEQNFYRRLKEKLSEW